MARAKKLGTAEITGEKKTRLDDGHKPKRPKYGNRRIMVDGITFDSKREAEHWLKLKALERAGKIFELERQTEYDLIVKMVLICKYRADFAYYDEWGIHHIVDAKGYKTAVYRLKKKLMLAIYGIEIEEV